MLHWLATHLPIAQVVTLTTFRVVNMLCWGSMTFFMAKGAWAASFGGGRRYGDPMRLACFSTGILVMLFNARWFIAPDSVEFWMALYVLSCGVAIYILRLALTYGRGPLV